MPIPRNRHWGSVKYETLKTNEVIAACKEDTEHGFLLVSFTVTAITWLSTAAYMYHRWPHICSVCHNPFLPSFMTQHLLCNKSNTTGTTSGAWTAYAKAFRSTRRVRSRILVEFVLFILSICISLHPWCDIRYDFRVKTVFDSAFLPYIL